jgi:hypothetical protein
MAYIRCFITLGAWIAACCVFPTSCFSEEVIADRFQSQVVPFLQKYCIDCHSTGNGEAGVEFDALDNQADAIAAGRLWVRALDALDSRSMPPVDAEQPSVEESEAVVEWIENDFVQSLVHEKLPLPAPVIRRLNRLEYNNTIRDLLHVNLDLAKELPADEIGYGFDNIGSVLSLSPVHLEKLFAAAERAATTALWAPSAEGMPPIELIGLKTYPLSEQVPVEFEHTLAPGLYLTEFSLVRAGISETVPPPLVKIGFGTDSRTVKAVRVQDETVVYRFWINVLDKDAKVTVAVAREKSESDNAASNQLVTNAVSGDQRYGNSYGLHVDSMVVRGPIAKLNPASFPAHDRILFARPAMQDDEARAAAAQEIIQSFVRRAFRRPASSAEIDRLMAIYRLGTDRGESFEHAMQIVMTSVLVSPQFFYLLEGNDERVDNRLTEHELASRLSYFLWSSMPDEELMRLADQGQLNTHLHAQVSRMLQDPKSESFVQAFCGQWLQLRRLDEVSPDKDLFPTFDQELREAMRKESELYFAYILRNNRSALELIDSNYTFVNQELAAHYGLVDFEGDGFQKKEVSSGQRGGVLTHASVLTVTSNPNRTSPVKRGKWVLQQILGTPPPPPPPIVEKLDDSASANEEASLRDRLIKHRENPACASCHAQMDPIGFAMENYDAIGRFRATDDHFPIDASGELPGGIRFEDSLEFKQKLKVIGKKRFSRSIVKNLMTYALGRGLELQDISTVEDIRKQLEHDDYRLQSVILGIVDSDAFRFRGGTRPSS